VTNASKADAVGVVGLGSMGRAIARRFSAGGHAVVACDVHAPAREAATVQAAAGEAATARAVARQAATARALARATARAAAREAATADGITVVACPHEVAARTAASLVLVRSNEEARRVVFGGEHGLLAGARAGHTILIGGAVSPATSRALGGAAERTRVDVVDAALCGGEESAADGTLLVLGGGSPEAFERVRPMLACIASGVHHLGPLGAVRELIKQLQEEKSTWPDGDRESARGI
jgi:3-hydroxyisobutyrate dehydrogenase-like beta-hydroxyacid dehydrogenase